MAKQVNTTGLCEIKFQTALGAGALKSLGYAEDMVNIEERAFYHNVPGDEHGGPQGPPIEVQFLGMIAVVSVTMSKWDPAELDTLRQRKLANIGQVASTEVGQLMLENNWTRIVLASPTRPMNFITCIIREAISYGMGTKYTGAVLQFEAHRTIATISGETVADKIWDADVTEWAGP